MGEGVKVHANLGKVCFFSLVDLVDELSFPRRGPQGHLLKERYLDPQKTISGCGNPTNRGFYHQNGW